MPPSFHARQEVRYRHHAQKATSLIVFLASFVLLFGPSWRLAQPLFSHTFPSPPMELPFLLIWPDHVQIRMFRNLSEVSPIPESAGYTFAIDPKRQPWIEEAVRATPSPNPHKSSWIIHITQIGAGRQKIDLELLGDGVYGMIYEAHTNKFVPLKWRLIGPGSASFVVAIDAALSMMVWTGYWFIRYRLKRSASLR